MTLADDRARCVGSAWERIANNFQPTVLQQRSNLAPFLLYSCSIIRKALHLSTSPDMIGRQIIISLPIIRSLV
jgi:hypothetical protein